jgi:hypothetical protein
VLRGGAAGQGAQVSLDGERGPALATATYGAAVFQSGRLSLRAGDARNASVSASTRYPPHSIALTAAEWTVYPCSGAGISFAADPANSFALALSSTFRYLTAHTARAFRTRRTRVPHSPPVNAGIAEGRAQAWATRRLCPMARATRRACRAAVPTRPTARAPRLPPRLSFLPDRWPSSFLFSLFINYIKIKNIYYIYLFFILLFVNFYLFLARRRR